MPIVLLAVAGAVLWIMTRKQEPIQPALTPVDFKSKFFDAFEKSITRGVRAKFAYAVASHESDAGKGKAFRLSNNLFSIHAKAMQGKPNAFWKGKTHMTTFGEELRVYDSWEASISDFCAGLAESPERYKKAYAAAQGTNPEAFFREMQASGYAGSSTTYARGLANRYREVA